MEDKLKKIVTDVFLLETLDAELFAFLEDYSQLAVLVDENTAAHCYPKLKPHLPAHTLIETQAGETHKNLDTCRRIWQQMTSLKMDRSAVCLNLGGGVLGDMGGFCAATYKRGIDFVQMPTTLLSQVDASVGGKLGIDFMGFKNHLGCFSFPQKVLIYPEFLGTLPVNELRSGFAEVLKHGLITQKKHWNDAIKEPLEGQDWEQLIPESVKIKANVVMQDPKERGLRKILNFGHTIGHAIEGHFLEDPEKRLLHGEAIAIGMIAEAWISNKKGLLGTEQLDEVCKAVTNFFPKFLILEEDVQKIAPLVLQDKKNKGGKVNCTLLSSIGNAVFDQPITLSEVTESLIFYNRT